MLDAQQGDEQFDLVAIAGIDIAVDFHHAYFPESSVLLPVTCHLGLS
jgi:hypothetical protein